MRKQFTTGGNTFSMIFLVLSVGIDDIFILTRAWDRTDPRHAIDERMASALEDAGPSITIRLVDLCVKQILEKVDNTPPPPISNICTYSYVTRHAKQHFYLTFCWEMLHFRVIA